MGEDGTDYSCNFPLSCLWSDDDLFSLSRKKRRNEIKKRKKKQTEQGMKNTKNTWNLKKNLNNMNYYTDTKVKN